MKNKIRSRSSIESPSNTAVRPRSGPQSSLMRTPLHRAAFIALCTILTGGAACLQGAEPDFNAPWPDAEKKGLWPKTEAPAAPKAPAETKPATPAQPAATPTPPPAQTPPAATSQPPGAPPPALTQAKPRKHEIAFSADYFFGQGDVSMPVFFSLDQTFQSVGLTSPFTPAVVKPDRESSYFGGTISYSYQYAWYIDLSYQHGTSSGSLDLNYSPSFPSLPSEFEIDDDWYQAYVRYTFPGLRGRRLSAYLRAGVSFVQSEMTDTTVFPNIGAYQQNNSTDDLLGNFGFGIGYSLYTTRRVRIGLQLEGEGFYGTRSQESLESLQGLSPSVLQTASIDNTLYGGIGRATVRFEYRLGQAGFFRIFADAGLQGKFTQVDYPDATGFSSQSFGEILWGPYAKLGLRYSF